MSGRTRATSGNVLLIARIESGLRPAVALAGAPPETRRLTDEMRRLHVPGVSIAVLRGGRIAWARGYGITHAGGARVTPDTLFQAGSISKPVAALAALMLVQRGLLALDTDVDERLTGWTLPAPPGQHATLRQLLAHRAGTTVHGFAGYAPGTPLPTVEQILAGAPPANNAPVTVDTPPGTAWRYSGGGYTVVQKLVADAAGRPFAEVVERDVLRPAGMHRSGFAQPLAPALLARAALPHDGAGRPIAGGPRLYPELAAAGLWSTPSDLARFALAIHRSATGRPGALLGRRLAAAMLTPGEGGYGLGLELRGTAADRGFSHGGSNQGYENILVAHAGTGDGVVVMTNAAQGNELGGEIVRSVAAAYGWSDFRSVVRRSVPVSAAARAQRPGEYAIAGLGTFAIAADADGLTLSLKTGVRERLYAMDERTYFILSQDLVVRFGDAPANGAAAAGRVVSGPFDLAFTPVRRP